MRFSDVSFPHPVLGLGDAVNSKFSLSPEPLIIPGLDTYTVTVYFDHDNADLTNLISVGKAEFFCEATCSNTLYRKVFQSLTNEISFIIPKKHVKGKISFTCGITAKEFIPNYQNSQAHPDYVGYSFEIDAGDILAFFSEFSFNADINYEKLKAVSSFMEVFENKDPDAVYTNVVVNKNKIEIQLPSEDYKIFANEDISKETNYAPIFHSSIVLNALLMALYNFEEHKDLIWAQVIAYRLKNETQFASLSLEEVEDIPEIAQRLLGNPFRRLMTGLEVINELQNVTEEL